MNKVKNIMTTEISNITKVLDDKSTLVTTKKNLKLDNAWYCLITMIIIIILLSIGLRLIKKYHNNQDNSCYGGYGINDINNDESNKENSNTQLENTNTQLENTNTQLENTNDEPSMMEEYKIIITNFINKIKNIFKK